ncbi:uncharacterized protein AB675_222 [Cyphellophora attinorum]|uniref:Uncharacterized protein n=1 Tax=Cyphellophora attinorum TaxID=1664694 RepID=A0A0N1NX24_9EURO|nr:uncharacterized protein AB675_222 [Phialophora attinorum]KPI37807.1 hypothetical protein AB675_222 [Phialophora attinorum]
MGHVSKSSLQQRPAEPPPPYQETVSQTVSAQSQQQTTNTMPSARMSAATGRGRRLSKTIAIPATTKKLGSPFLRAYPPSLEAYSISQADFVKFVDTLNRVAVKSPPLEAIGLAGSVLQFVPVHSINLIGMGVDLGSKIVGRALSKGRTELFLRKVNREMFAPRGLKVEIAQLDGLAKIAGIPVLDEEGKVVKKATLLEPLGESGDDVGDGAARLDVQQRRLKTLEEYIAPLQTEGLPQIEDRSNPLSQWSVKSSERQRQRGEKRMLKGRDKADAKLEKKTAKAERKREKRLDKVESKLPTVDASDSTTLESLSSLEERVRAHGDAKAERKLEKAERKYRRRIDKASEKSLHNKREEKSLRKILWIIIRDVDADSGDGENPDVGSDFTLEDGSDDSSEVASSSEDELERSKIEKA